MRRTERVPYCECNDFNCLVPLGIDWPEFRAIHALGVLIAPGCSTPEDTSCGPIVRMGGVK